LRDKEQDKKEKKKKKKKRVAHKGKSILRISYGAKISGMR